MCISSCILENEVDGEGFLLLTDEDIGDMVKPLGVRRKLITKRNMLTCVSTFVAVFKDLAILYTSVVKTTYRLCASYYKRMYSR